MRFIGDQIPLFPDNREDGVNAGYIMIRVMRYEVPRGGIFYHQDK